MRNHFYLTSAFLMLLCISCTEDLNVRSDGKIAASASGYTFVSAYDLGGTNEIELSVAKVGLNLSDATVTFTADAALLDSMNRMGGTNYEVLPSDCYTIENATFAVPSANDRRVVGGKLIYDPHKIFLKCGFNNLKYVLPLRITSTGMPMVPDRTSVLYGFRVQEAVLNFVTGGSNITATDKVQPVTLTTEVGFENQWNLSTTFAARGADYVEQYNKDNKTPFDLLPADMYTIAPAVIAKGKTIGTTQLVVKDALPAGNYLLALSLNNLSGNEGASIGYDNTYVANFGIMKGVNINRSNWSITANTEEATGEGANNGKAIHMIDGSTSTFWHSRWSGGEVAPPYELIIDMKKQNSLASIGLIARQNALTRMNIEFSLSNDGTNWSNKTDFYFDGSIKTEQRVLLKTTQARYIRMYVSSLTGSTVGHMAELYAYGQEGN